ncbi:hypothetical protein BK648_24825 [Pseudomonas poae]|uniref:HTH tetR-type domain-containing protein n=1 Tax=Pseudomonas poae TaxID=200451 RepID=A0A423ERN8_9PSED|nr:TetR/AcrR family transcriptional regulator [Pseudomonas poae]ROM33985.1 hypothetical protein BK648_24825 [Pseudomonas poae]
MQPTTTHAPELPVLAARSTDLTVSEVSLANDRHQQIRDFALNMFVTHGYGNVSLRQLAEPLGLRAGSLYNHLESKQALLFELIHDHMQHLLDSVRREVGKARNQATKLRAFIATHLYFHTRYQSLSLLSNLELRSLECAYQDEIKSLLKQYRGCLSEILKQGMASGVFRTQPISGAVQAILAMLSGVAFWFDEHDQIDSKQLTRQFTHMVFGALGAAPGLIHRLAP